MLIISQPRKASEIISSSLPEILEFYRIPIPDPEREISRESQPLPIGDGSLDTDSAADSVRRGRADLVPIYGSVTTMDVAEQVKALLGETEEGARVVLGAEDITILNYGGEKVNDEADRLKMLGDFPVDIRVKNGEAVRRTVSVRVL